MAERKIVRGVFLNNKMFTPGMEEELSNTLTQAAVCKGLPGRQMDRERQGSHGV